MLTLLLLTGCGGTALKQIDWRDAAINRVWPESPESPRIRLLRSLSADTFRQQDQQRNSLLRWVSGEELELLPLVTPYDVTTDGQGTIWVTDPSSGLVHVFNLRQGTVDYLTSAGSYRFETPSGIYYDRAKQQLYLADSTQKRVFQLNRSGEYLQQFGSPQLFQRPAGIALDQHGNLLVADVLAGVIRRFDQNGKALTDFGSRITEDGRFNHPLALAVDPAGNIYVLDSLNFRVEVLTGEGEHLGSIGSLGDVPGTFSRPRGLAVDGAGRIYVSDAAFDNIQIFNPQGRLLLYFGRDKHWSLSMPAGIAIDPSGHVIVADSFNQRLLVYQQLPVAGK